MVGLSSSKQATAVAGQFRTCLRLYGSQMLLAFSALFFVAGIRIRNAPIPSSTASSQPTLEQKSTILRGGNSLPEVASSSHARPGGRKLYIDLGANCGNSYWRAKLGKSEGTAETLKLPSPDVWETYLWECNPKLIEWFLNDLVKTEPNVVLIPKAATTSNGSITFHLTAGQEGLTKEQSPNPTCDPDSPYQPGGASSIYGNADRAGQAITVEAVDFLAWHKALNLKPGDSVHMKIDIEGAELGIIEQFLMHDDTNQICYWDAFWMEYHKLIFPPGTADYIEHEKFENEFPARFQQKCGRPLWPNVWM